MGGNALQHLGASRLQREEALDLTERALTRLQQLFAELGLPSPTASAIRAYASKDSFGDVDLVVNNRIRELISDERMGELLASLSVDAKPLPYVTDTPNPETLTKAPLVSYGVRLSSGALAQMDLLYTEPEHFQSTVDIYAWNDLGGHIASVLKMWGLTLTDKGLFFRVYDETALVGIIHLESDFTRILALFGWDVDAWRKGFDTLEDTFRYLTSSRYFSRQAFARMNHRARKRGQRRANFAKLTEFLEANPPKNEFNYPENERLMKPELWRKFPGFLPQHVTMMADYRNRKAARSKFNGNLVSEWTGLHGKALGDLMDAYRASKADFGAYLVNHSEDELKLDIQFFQQSR